MVNNVISIGKHESEDSTKNYSLQIGSYGLSELIKLDSS